MGSIGDLYKARKKNDVAASYYLKAAEACERHMKQEKDSYLRLHVRLGIGRQRAKAGDLDAAISTLQNLIADAKNEPVVGAAHFYLGQVYEFQRKDNVKALAHYRIALGAAGGVDSFASPLDVFLDYESDHGAGGKSVYAVAALTDTITDANAARGKIVESIGNITGEKNNVAVRPFPKTGETEKPAGPENEDPMIIIMGR